MLKIVFFKLDRTIIFVAALENIPRMERTKKILPFALLILSLILTSSYHISSYVRPEESIDPAFLDAGGDWVDSVYESLSRDERIAQLFMVRAYSNMSKAHSDSILKLIRKFNIGGLCFFQGGPIRQANLTNLYQAETKTPLLVAQDAEWGPAFRLDSIMAYPRQMTLGALQEEDLIRQMGREVAVQLKMIGVNMNLAPVMDVNNNPRNPVIGSRSFGEDQNNVSRKGIAYILGMQELGVLCTAKHFPGHGDTDKDSHHTLPQINHTRERLWSTEMYPFQQAIHQGLTGIMVAHLEVPALDPESDMASSLSRQIVTGVLKEEMGFRGLIVTDALDMSGADMHHSPGELEAMAFKAGNDILLIPSSVPKGISAIKKEIRKGNLSWERVEESCKKILAAKYWAALEHPLPTAGMTKKLNDNNFLVTRSRLYQKALTLLDNQDDIIPLKGLDTLRIATVIIGDTGHNVFQKYIDLYLPSTHFNISREASAESYMELLGKLDSFNLIIAGVHNTDMRASRNFGIKENSILFLNRLTSQKPTIAAIFASPYSLSRFNFGSELKALLMAHEDKPIVQGLSVQLMFGAIPASGILPVSAGSRYKAGDGISTEAAYRLRYGLPEEEGIDSRLLYKIDSIVLDAIQAKATPGCQVLAARNGLVFYHKSFGYHTYGRKDTVNWDDLYDVASITKITATLPVLMQLTQQRKFDVNDRLGKYMPDLDTCNKGDLLIKDILTHHAGLTPWIPFYYSLIEPMDADQDLISKKLSSNYPFRLAGHIFLNKNIKYVNGAFRTEPSLQYPIRVADNLFLNRNYRDSIMHRILNSGLREKQEYLYSDLGYYFLHPIVDSLTGMPLEQYTSEKFYRPLGSNFTGFLPLKRFPLERIIPTENDLVFRRQLLQGYVHDPGAAMLGGVAGHAGIFSNANDLAKIMQMYLNGGHYGGIDFIADSIIDKFNTCIHCEDGNRRGIGFDKPEMDFEKDGPTCQCVSPASFGHSGFTGTLVWADPDTGLLYVFLSNKIHPDQDNPKLVEMDVRTNIQQVLHDALMY
ncbi:glycoside hydrolase family 3 N-terminal domain-containing protein [Bacteroidota bacterium]